mgnify:CR=1 FL=1
MIVNNFIHLTDPINTNAYVNGNSYKLNTITKIVELKDALGVLNSKTYSFIGAQLTADQYGPNGEPRVLLREDAESETDFAVISALSSDLITKIEEIKTIILNEVSV